MTMSETERRARELLGDEIADEVLAAAREGPVFTQAQTDFLVRAFGPLIRGAHEDGGETTAA